MTKKNKTETRPMIVCFSNDNAKSQLYKVRINQRNATLHDLRGEVFTNENLNAWRAELFREARKVIKNITMEKRDSMKIFVLKTD